AGLLYHHRVARGASALVEDALCKSLGSDYESRIRDDLREQLDATISARQIAGFLPWRPREVERSGVNVIYFQSGRHKLALDVYRHHSRPERCPALLYVHGGGWVIGNKRQQG